MPILLQNGTNGLHGLPVLQLVDQGERGDAETVSTSMGLTFHSTNVHGVNTLKKLKVVSRHLVQVN